MIKFFFAILIIGIYSGCICSSPFYGKFASPDKAISLEISPDKSYIYRYVNFHVSENSRGTWTRLSKNEWLLSSSVKESSLPVAISSRKSASEDMHISFKFISELRLSNYKVGIFVDDILCRVSKANHLEKIVSENKNVKTLQDINEYNNNFIRCDSLKELTVNFNDKKIFFMLFKQQIDPYTTQYFRIGATSDTLILSDVRNKILEVTINDAAFSSKIFDSVKVERDRKNLKLFDKDAKKWIHLKRQK